MQLKKHLVRWLCLLLLVTAVVGVTIASAAEAEVSTAAVDGLVLEDMTILYPANATDVEMTAAKELQAYLQKATGKKPNMFKEYTGCPKGIYVGATNFAANNNVTYTDNNGQGEGWVVKVVGNNVVVTGGSTRGVLYAAYHLLEDVVGVHWWNMYEEYVPSLTDAVIPTNYADSGEPIFTFRDVYFAENAKSLFHVRNRLNGFAGYIPAEYGGEMDYTGPYHVHTFGRYFPSSTYFETHPEWYAYDKETGARISDGQLCLSNEELLTEFTNKVLASIKSAYAAADKAGKPRPLYTDITPDDRDGHCECDACMASKAASGESGHLFKFVNKIAAVVKEQYPDIIVETLAYAQYRDLPLDDTVPADNVVIRLASNDMDIMHSLTHPNNRPSYARLHDWAEILQPGQLLYWDYGMMTQRYNGTMPNFFRFAEDYQTLYEAGCSGIFLENGSMNCAEMWDARAWIAAKIIEDPYQDIHEVAKEFATGYYGPAGGLDVYNYMVFMAQDADSYSRPTLFGNLTIDAAWMTGADALKANKYFDDAVAKTEADTSLSESDRQLYLERINVARNALDRTLLYNYNRFSYELAESGRSLGISREEIGRRMYVALEWLHYQTVSYEDHTGVIDLKSRGEYNTSAWFLMSRYARYRGEVNEDGTKWYPEIPQEILDDYPDLDPSHIYDYPAVTFAGNANYTSLVPNAASYEGGSALLIDQAVVEQYNAENGISSSYHLFSETKAFHMNIESPMVIGSPLVADGQYHMYKMEDVMAFASDRPNISMLGCFTVAMEGLDQIYNKKGVDVYFSMKIDGDPSSGTAKIYIDRLTVVEDCSFYDIPTTSQIGATCTSNAYGEGPCPICGKITRSEVEGSKLPHATTGAYTYNSADGSYSASCSVCGTAVYHQFENKLPDDLLNYLKKKGIGLEHVREFDVNNFTMAGSNASLVADDTTPVGKAAKQSNGTITFVLSTHGDIEGGSQSFGSVSATTVKLNAGNGYKVYELSGGTIPSVGYHYWYTFYWNVQSKVMVQQLKDLAGQKVGAYLSVKSVRTGGSFMSGYTYDYYFDRCWIVEPCGGCGAGRASDNYAVRFNSNGGSHVPETGVKSGSKLTAPTSPIKEGYTFVGWYLGDTAYDFNTAVTKPMTLTAKWETDITYVARTGHVNYEFLSDAVAATVEGGTMELLADTDEAVAVAKELTIVRNGFTASGLTPEYGFGMTAGGTYYKVWDKAAVPSNLLAPLPAEVQADLEANGGSMAHVHDYGINSFKAEADNTVHYAYADPASALGTTLAFNAAKCSAVVRQDTYIFNDSKPFQLYHQMWEGTAEPLTAIPASDLNANNADGEYHIYKMSGVVVPSGFRYLKGFGYSIQNNFADIKSHITNKTVDLYLSMKVEGNVSYVEGEDSALIPKYYVDRMILVDYPVECTVTFDVDGVTSTATIVEGETVTAPADPEKEGFTFDGWFLNGVKYDFTQPVTGDITLVAQFTEIPVEYMVSFEVDGIEENWEFVSHGQTVAEPVAPSKEGFTFDGWFLNGVKYDFTQPVTGDIVLVAQFTEIVVEPEEIPYQFTTSMTASLELESEVFLNVAPQMTDLDGNALTAAEAQAIEGNVGMLIWDAATAPAEADATIDTCDNVILGATYNTSTKRFDVKSAGIAAKNLGDSLTIRAFYKDGDQVIYGKYVAGYSPKKYCYNQITKAAATKDVCIALLNYGAAAQVYFGHNTENMMNSELTAAQQTIAWTDDLVRSTWTVDAAKEGGLTRQNPPVNSRAGTLELEGAINVVFTGGATGITVDKAQLLIWTEADFEANDVLTAENATEVVDMNLRSDGKYEYTYTGVPAKGMFDVIYACQMYTDTDGNVYYGGVLPFCAERYGFMNYNKSDAKVANLAKTMIVYGAAARDYFG